MRIKNHFHISGFTLTLALKQRLGATRTRVFSHDVMAAILVSQNNEAAAMLVSQTNPVGVKLFSYANASFCTIKLHKCWQREWKYCIECFHSRGQHLCKCFGTKEIICIRKEFISHRTGLGHQHGHRFIVLGHQYGRRDVMWKHSIAYSHTFKISKRCFYFFWRKYGRVIKYMYVVSLTRSRTNSYLNCIILSTLSWKGLKR